MPMLDFKGKQHIYAHHLTVPYRPLVPDAGRSLNAGGDADGNLIIHGDNLDGLKALLPRYAGRVKCVYIDPPYNTGNEGWVYNDRVNSPLMREWLRQNSPVDGEDLERHDKWLCMMWPRLHLLKELLSDDGVIFVSIDDNEQHHLRMLMDEIFGEGNFRNILSVARVRKNTREDKGVRSLNRGYNLIMLYAKSESGILTPPTIYQEKGERWHAFDAPGETSTAYELFGMFPPKGRHWMYSKERADELIANGRLRRNPRTGKPQYLLDASNSTALDSNWTDMQEYDTRFDFPNGEKNVKLIERVVKMVDDKDAIILDSFAGSGTTAHAVLALNKEDGGNRKFILVECEDYADTITAERVRRVIGGVPGARDKSLRDGLGGSFTYCTLGAPIDAETMLTGEHLPAYSELAAYLLHTSSGIAVGAETLAAQDEDGLFYEDDRARYYLLYRPDIPWLQSNEGMLNGERAQRISAARAAGKRAIVFGPGKYIGQRALTDLGITFAQLPYEMHYPVR